MKIPETVVFQNLIGALREIQGKIRADPRNFGGLIKAIPGQVDALTSVGGPDLGA
jgi:hypothetical protein